MDAEHRQHEREANRSLDQAADARVDNDRRRLPAALWNAATRVRCQLAFACPKGWDAMEPTDQPDVRFCDHCQSQVHEVRTAEAFWEHARAERCVSVPADADVQVVANRDGTIRRAQQLPGPGHRLTGPAVRPSRLPWLAVLTGVAAAGYGAYRLGLATGWW
jgi:hypothetical protein